MSDIYRTSSFVFVFESNILKAHFVFIIIDDAVAVLSSISMRMYV